MIQGPRGLGSTGGKHRASGVSMAAREASAGIVTREPRAQVATDRAYG